MAALTTAQFPETTQLYMNQPLTGYDPETQALVAQAERRRRIANMLLQQGLSSGPNTQSTGKYLVPRSPLQGFADLAKVALGAYGNAQSDQAQQSVIDASQSKDAATRAELAQAMAGPQATQTELAGPGAPVQKDLVGSDAYLSQLSPQEVAQGRWQQELDRRGPGAYQEGPRPTGMVQPPPDSPPDKYARLTQLLASKDPRTQAMYQPMVQNLHNDVMRAETQQFQAEQKGLDRQNRLDAAQQGFGRDIILAQAAGASKETLAAMQAQHAQQLADVNNLASQQRAELPVQPTVIVDPKSSTGYSTIDARTKQMIGEAPPPASITNAESKASRNLSPAAQKELFEADDMIAASQNAVSSLKHALSLNDTAYSGALAKERAGIASNVPGMANKGANAAISMDNIVTGQALEQLKATFGGMPTEGERKILLDIQGSVNLHANQRKEIWERAIQLAQRREAINRQKAEQLRGGTYMKPGGGTADVPPVSYGAPPATGAPAAPVQTPARSITRTGKTKDGRRVVEYSDGTIEYAQ